MRPTLLRPTHALGAAGLLAALACAAAGCSQGAETAPAKPPSGESVFLANCAECHGERGVGIEGSGVPLARASKMEPAAIKQIVQKGRGKMPAISTLQEPELGMVVDYVRQLPGAAAR